MLPSARLLIRLIAEIADQRLGLGVNSFHSRAPERRPGAHLSNLFGPTTSIAAYSRGVGNSFSDGHSISPPPSGGGPGREAAQESIWIAPRRA
jgi:hypothetical protein